ILWVTSLAGTWWYASKSGDRQRDKITNTSIEISDKISAGNYSAVYKQTTKSFKDNVTEAELAHSLKKIAGEKLKAGSINEAYTGYTEHLVQHDLLNDKNESQGTL